MKKMLVRALFRLGARINGRYATHILTDSDEGLFLVNQMDIEIGKRMRYLGSYSKDELEILKSLLTPDSVVVIAGAHWGLMSIPLSKSVRKLIAIEANPSTFQTLQMNVNLNRAENIDLHNVALGETEGELSMQWSRSNSGGSKRKPSGSDNAPSNARLQNFTVPMKPLDQLIGENEKIDLMLIDIEGSEYFALLGAKKNIGNIQILVIEYIHHHLRDVAKISVSTFLEPIIDHFEFLYVPTLKRQFNRDEFHSILTEMYENQKDDPGLVFSKRALNL